MEKVERVKWLCGGRVFKAEVRSICKVGDNSVFILFKKYDGGYRRLSRIIMVGNSMIWN